MESRYSDKKQDGLALISCHTTLFNLRSP